MRRSPSSRVAPAGVGVVVCLLLQTAAVAWAQTPLEPKPGQDEYRINVDVDLVMVHASVVDRAGQLVTDLKRENFVVLEDGVGQPLAVFLREDIPVSLGLVIDNSGSMAPKLEQVNRAALLFVRTSNPNDETFVVTFNDYVFVDEEAGFTSDLAELERRLRRTPPRGQTALYDAIRTSADLLRPGHRDKKVLLVITDGEDNASADSFDLVMRYAQQSNAAVYTVGLLAEELPVVAARARRVLTRLAEATGGAAYFPKKVEEVEAVCQAIAREIRSQYTLGYAPLNRARDGSYRKIEVRLHGEAVERGLQVRARTGYFAREPEAPKR